MLIKLISLSTTLIQYILRRSGVWSFRAICLEQSPHWTPPIWSFSWTVPPSAKNVFVLTGSAVTVLLVHRLQIRLLTYYDNTVLHASLSMW